MLALFKLLINAFRIFGLNAVVEIVKITIIMAAYLSHCKFEVRPILRCWILGGLILAEILCQESSGGGISKLYNRASEVCMFFLMCKLKITQW